MNELSLRENNLNESVFFIDILKSSISSNRIPITIEVLCRDTPIELYKTTFLAPINKTDL